MAEGIQKTSVWKWVVFLLPPIPTTSARRHLEKSRRENRENARLYWRPKLMGALRKISDDRGGNRADMYRIPQRVQTMREPSGRIGVSYDM